MGRSYHRNNAIGRLPNRPSSESDQESERTTGRLPKSLSSTKFINDNNHYLQAANADHFKPLQRSLSLSDIDPSQNQVGLSAKDMSELSEWLSFTDFGDDEGVKLASSKSKRQAPSRRNSCPVEVSKCWLEPCPQPKKVMGVRPSKSWPAVASSLSQDYCPKPKKLKFHHQPRNISNDNLTHPDLNGLPHRSCFRRANAQSDDSRRVTFSDDEPDEPNQVATWYNLSSIERSINSVNPTHSGGCLPSFRQTVNLPDDEPDERNQAATSYNSSVPTISKRSILEESDKVIVTRYFFEVMKQMQRCSFRKSDVVGKCPAHSIGYPGLECRHCRGRCMNHGRFFPRKKKSFIDRSKSIDAFAKHLEKCHACPDEIKDNLTQLKDTHAQEIIELRAKGVTKSQKKFLERIWNRLHLSDE